MFVYFSNMAALNIWTEQGVLKYPNLCFGVICYL